MSQFIPILAANCFFDASGAPMDGELVVQAVDGTGKFVPFRIGSAGQVLISSVSRRITAGSLATPLQLADPAQTSPTNIGYRFTVVSFGSMPTVYDRVLITADVNGNFDFTKLQAGNYVTTVPVVTITGPPGPHGEAISTISLPAASTISAYTAVAMSAGSATTALATDPNLTAVGIATAGALAQGNVVIQYGGPIVYNGWSWTLGHPIFVGPTGSLTQIPPTSGYLQIVGYPLSATSFLIYLQAPISL